MRTEVAIVPALMLLGCVSHSTREDLDAIGAMDGVREHMELAERGRAQERESDAAVASILAEPLDVDAAVRVALLSNRDLRASLAELGIARGDLVQAGLMPNPTVEAEVRFPEDQMQPPQVDVGVAIDLTGMILAPLRTEVATARMEAARLRTAAAVLDLAYRVRLAFYRAQASQQMLELMRTAQEAFQAAVSAARALYQAGNVRELDVAIEEAALEQARIDTARAELELLDDRERLNVLMGLFGRRVQWQMAGRMPDPVEARLEEAELESRAIDASLELAQTRADLEAVARSIGLARAVGAVPDLEIGFHAEYDEARWEYGPELAITLPIFSQGQGTVLSREAQLEALRERYVGLAIGVRASVRAARNRAVASELLARRHRDVLIPARTRVFEQTLRLYNAMQIDVFRLLQSRREQLEAARAYIEALRDYWQARATLDQVLAGRLAGTIGPDADMPRTTTRIRSSGSAESPH